MGTICTYRPKACIALALGQRIQKKSIRVRSSHRQGL